MFCEFGGKRRWRAVSRAKTKDRCLGLLVTLTARRDDGSIDRIPCCSRVCPLFYESAAILSLILYVVVAATLILQDLLACSDGWRLWVLHVVSRLYTPFMFRQRVSGLCPLPGHGPGLVIANHRSPVDTLDYVFAWPSPKTALTRLVLQDRCTRAARLARSETSDGGGDESGHPGSVRHQRLH